MRIGPVVELRSAGLSAGVAPELGGALLWLRSGGPGTAVDWMRPMPEEGGEVRDAASFPLVPFSNRIAGARFGHDGREVRLQPNWPGPMAIHGSGWTAAWTIAEQGDEAVTLALSLGDGDWPWPADARLTYRVTGTALAMTLALTNRSQRAMPSGLGFHPYFPKPQGTGLTAECAAWLATDEARLPVSIVAPDRVLDGLRVGRLPQEGFDNALTGWTGTARVTWPGGRHLDVVSEPATAFAVLYVPADSDYFCFEPVTHIPNAHNLQDGRLGAHGLVALEPGATHRFAAEFRPGTA